MTGRWRRARVVASAGVLVAGVWGVSASLSVDQNRKGPTGTGTPTVPLTPAGERP